MHKTFALIILSAAALFAQRADFFREDITFRLDNGRMDVDGYYWLANNSALTVRSEIFYPFPKHQVDEIDSIRVFNISRGEGLHMKKAVRTEYILISL